MQGFMVQVVSRGQCWEVWDESKHRTLHPKFSTLNHAPNKLELVGLVSPKAPKLSIRDSSWSS